MLASMAAVAHRRGTHMTAVAALLGVAFACGALRLALARQPDPLDIAAFALDGAVADVEGVVVRAPEAFGAAGEHDGAAPGSFMVLDAESVAIGGGRRKVRGGLRVVVGEGTPAL
ncbi:MAG: hypothetical protein K8T20_14830, partial [Planctomycetes bacterium]|nr:hypothetical protein [Planctomycetota bacterium]